MSERSPSLPELSSSASACAPASGTPRYFALLYCPLAHRAALTTLLALGDEINSGTAKNLDHSVAHLRLQWWQHEAEQFERGQAQHPWLRVLQAADGSLRSLDLQPLVAAAAADLASQTLRGDSGDELQRVLFRLAARVLLGQPASLPQQQLIGELGANTQALERAGAHDAHDNYQRLQRQIAELDVALQLPLAPLLVWCALAARRYRQRKSRSTFDAFGDNIAAWRAARRAAQAHFRL